MSRSIKITAGDVEARARLYDNEMADDIWEILPVEGDASTWGDEIYFSIPIESGYSGRKAEVEVGELAFWEPGNAFCIFFGPTPMSQGDKPRPANPVNAFGMVEGEVSIFKQVSQGTTVRVTREE